MGDHHAPSTVPLAKTGRPRELLMREIMNAIFYVLRLTTLGTCCGGLPADDHGLWLAYEGTFASRLMATA